MTGINKYSEKERREQRRRNHVAKDLWSGKYKQQIVPMRKRDQLNDNDEYFFVENDDND